MQIYDFAKRFPLPHLPHSKKGTALFKIGFMLEELGVLPPRPLEAGRGIQTLLNFFGHPPSRILLKQYLDNLSQRNRTQSTRCAVLYALKNFQLWLTKDSPSASLLEVNPKHIANYLDHLVQ